MIVKCFKIRYNFRKILETELDFTRLKILILWEDIDAKVRESLRNRSGHAGSFRFSGYRPELLKHFVFTESYKSLAWLKRRIQWERKNRKRSSPVLKEELIARYNVGCETSRSVDVCESNQVTLEPCWVCLRVSFSDYATDQGSKIYFI